MILGARVLYIAKTTLLFKLLLCKYTSLLTVLFNLKVIKDICQSTNYYKRYLSVYQLF